ncbi:hypothetical protein JXJ21_25925 [candidate division KSB1 bacterium]|nr:hypothetical protein [candidate division KSB1 bacterium]
MDPTFLPDDFVPCGFEIVIDNQDAEMGKAWNLWFNVTLSDHPEKWDSEIEAINKMEARLKPRSRNQRFIRAQIAEFCRFHPSFPHSVEVLCEAITTGSLSMSISAGCEGRGLLQSFGYHDEESVAIEVTAYIMQLANALRKWQQQQIPRTTIDRKCFGFLGVPTPVKRRFIEKLLPALESAGNSILPLRELCRALCLQFQGSIRKQCRPFNCLDCLPANETSPMCKCTSAMLPDAALLYSGLEDDGDTLCREFNRFIQENSLAYAIAINAWLENEPCQVPEAFDSGKYVSGDDAIQISDRIRKLLGARDDAKEWLAACLLKTVKSNQQWHKTEQLIYDYPESTTYLRKNQ